MLQYKLIIHISVLEIFFPILVVFGNKWKIVPAKLCTPLYLTGDALPSLQLETFATLNKEMMAGTLAKHLKYLTGGNKKDKLHVLTAWTVVDLETPQGRELFRGALTQFKASNQMRIGKQKI